MKEVGWSSGLVCDSGATSDNEIVDNYCGDTSVTVMGEPLTRLLDNAYRGYRCDYVNKRKRIAMLECGSIFAKIFVCLSFLANGGLVFSAATSPRSEFSVSPA